MLAIVHDMQQLFPTSYAQPSGSHNPGGDGCGGAERLSANDIELQGFVSVWQTSFAADYESSISWTCAYVLNQYDSDSGYTQIIGVLFLSEAHVYALLLL